MIEVVYIAAVLMASTATAVVQLDVSVLLRVFVSNMSIFDSKTSTWKPTTFDILQHLDDDQYGMNVSNRSTMYAQAHTTY